MEERLQELLHRHGAGAGAAAAVRGGEGLVEVVVHHVHAEVARLRDADEGVHVRPIHVQQGAGVVDHLGDLDDLRLEPADGARVGEHQRRDVGSERGLERREIGESLGVGLDAADGEAGQGRRRGVRPVRRVGDDDDLAGRVAARAVVGGDEEDARHLALRARGGLQRDGVHPGDLLEPLAELVHQRQGALRLRVGRHRVDAREARQPRHVLVHLGVVLHRARPQGIERAVHVVVLEGELDVVAHHLELRDLGEVRGAGAQRARGQHVGGSLGDDRLRYGHARAPLAGALEDHRGLSRLERKGEHRILRSCMTGRAGG
jgi:hypothetical protein